MARFIFVIFVLALMLASCGIRRVGTGTAGTEETQKTPELDPLATEQDREVVPEVYPVRMFNPDDAGDSLVQPQDINTGMDSTLSDVSPEEVYRVQVFTSRLYAEAARERELAEEIFNLPIYLDYEVPYYKLRVGEFENRDQAESMLSEIKNLGYSNAWVARVVLRVREAPEYDLTEEPILPDETGDTLKTPEDSNGLNDGSDND